MPKQTNAKKKVVASKGGRTISTPLGILIVLGAGLLLAVIGTFGYSKYQESNLKAKAGSYTALPGFNNSGITVSACKKPGQSASSYKVTVIATKAPETRLTKKLRDFPNETSQNPVYGVYLAQKAPLYDEFKLFQYQWTRHDDFFYKSKSETPWWGGVVNAREYGNVPVGAKIAAQGASDQGGLQLYDNDLYLINRDKIYAPNFSDYWSKGGNFTVESANWLKVVKAWEARTVNVADLANCS